MAPPKILPSAEYLHQCFSYDPETGVLTWKRRPRAHFVSARTCAWWNTKYSGKPAGLWFDGYLRLKISGIQYEAARVIFKMMTDEEPPETIDHKDGNQSNNRWANLRPATKAEQSRNRGGSGGVSGITGVFPKNGRWTVVISRRYLGIFATREEAAAVYEAAARELFGEFYRE
jgi:hypothetical protein